MQKLPMMLAKLINAVPTAKKSFSGFRQSVLCAYAFFIIILCPAAENYSNTCLGGHRRVFFLLDMHFSTSDVYSLVYRA